jgi:SAM-dependent methyltransferase
MISLLKLLYTDGQANNYTNPKYVGSRFRKKRFNFFELKIKNFAHPITILDIGGTVRFWVNENYHLKDVFITIVNIRQDESNYPNIRVVEADACNLSQFKDKSFDISFSNSLIEHLETKENQIKMANEAMRVSRCFFIQTPNRYFPIEPHFKFPSFQFLPRRIKIFLQTKTALINGVKYNEKYAEEIVDEIRLLSGAELLSLFPKSHLYIEYFLGMPKSFIAYSFPPTIVMAEKNYSRVW